MPLDPPVTTAARDAMARERTSVAAMTTVLELRGSAAEVFTALQAATRIRRRGQRCGHVLRAARAPAGLGRAVLGGSRAPRRRTRCGPRLPRGPQPRRALAR